MAILRQVHRKTPKWPWTLKVIGIPYTYGNFPNPNFQSLNFTSTARHFQVGGRFGRSAPSDPKMALNTLRSKVPILHITTPGTQISFRFAPWQAVFELQAILRQVHCMTPKWPFKGTPYTCYYYPWFQNVTPFPSMATVFSSALCYCTAELLSSRGRPSSVVVRRP